MTSSFREDVSVKMGRITCKLEIRFKSPSEITGNHTLVSLLVSVLETQVSQLYLSALSLPAHITYYLLSHTTKPIEQNMLNTRVGQRVSTQCIYFGFTIINSNNTVHFMFFESYIVIYLCNKNQQNAHFYINILI